MDKSPADVDCEYIRSRQRSTLCLVMDLLTLSGACPTTIPMAPLRSLSFFRPVTTTTSSTLNIYKKIIKKTVKLSSLMVFTVFPLNSTVPFSVPKMS